MYTIYFKFVLLSMTAENGMIFKNKTFIRRSFLLIVISGS